MDKFLDRPARGEAPGTPDGGGFRGQSVNQTETSNLDRRNPPKQGQPEASKGWRKGGDATQ